MLAAAKLFCAKHVATIISIWQNGYIDPLQAARKKCMQMAQERVGDAFFRMDNDNNMKQRPSPGIPPAYTPWAGDLFASVQMAFTLEDGSQQ